MISLFTRKTEGKPKIANKKVNPINSDWSFSSNNNIIGKPQKTINILNTEKYALQPQAIFYT